MPRLSEMTPEEVRAHDEWIRSPEGQEAILRHYEEEERMRRSVTAEQAAAREMQEVVLDDLGTPRFRENVLVTNLFSSIGRQRGDAEEPWMAVQLERLLGPEGNAIVGWLARPENRGRKDLNDVAEEGRWTQKDWEQLAMLIGYSISGAGDLGYFSDAMWDRANAEGERLLEEAKRR